MQERLKVYEEKMNKSYDALLNEYTSIRAGRANPHVLDKIKVDYYGAPTPLQQVANISVPEPRMILIQPWEKKLIKDIEKAILTSDLGINPNNDGSAVRLIFPELTEERRKDLAKDVKKKGEGAKVAVRNIRRDGNVAFKKLKGTEISEDEILHYNVDSSSQYKYTVVIQKEDRPDEIGSTLKTFEVDKRTGTAKDVSTKIILNLYE